MTTSTDFIRETEALAVDNLIDRNKQAKAVLYLLRTVITSDSPPTDAFVEDVIGAAITLLAE